MSDVLAVVAAVVAVLALGVSAWALVYAHRQTKLAKRSADIAEEALRLESDAELVLNVQAVKPEKETAMVFPRYMLVRYTLSNVGRGPALRVRFAVEPRETMRGIDLLVGDLAAGVTAVLDDSESQVALPSMAEFRRIADPTNPLAATVSWQGRGGVARSFRSEFYV